MKYLLIILALTYNLSAQAESKHINVYATTEAYWDVRSGDTLSEIVAQLLSRFTAGRIQLMADIVKLNPSAFSEYNPDFMQANIRLRLPGHSLHLNRVMNQNTYRNQAFSWGFIHHRK